MARELTYHYRVHQDGTIQQLIPHHEWSTRMTNHIDQLREWWETAEVGDPKDGDVIIEWAGDGHAVRTFLEAERDDLYAACTYRILARAPKPKPAWHDSVAVIAHTDDLTRSAWVRSVADQWETIDGYVAYSDDLRDVTPLIEAKVTDEMVKRARAESNKWEFGGISGNAARAILTAALGLETP